MDFLEERRASSGKVHVAVVGGGDEMIAKESVSRREARSGHRSLAIRVQGDV
jgi:hypothetical protein